LKVKLNPVPSTIAPKSSERVNQVWSTENEFVLLTRVTRSSQHDVPSATVFTLGCNARQGLVSQCWSLGRQGAIPTGYF